MTVSCCIVPIVILIHELLFLSILKSSGSRTAVRLSAPLWREEWGMLCVKYTSERGRRKPNGARFAFCGTKFRRKGKNILTFAAYPI